MCVSRWRLGRQAGPSSTAASVDWRDTQAINTVGRVCRPAFRQTGERDEGQSTNYGTSRLDVLQRLMTTNVIDSSLSRDAVTRLAASIVPKRRRRTYAAHQPNHSVQRNSHESYSRLNPAHRIPHPRTQQHPPPPSPFRVTSATSDQSACVEGRWCTADRHAHSHTHAGVRAVARHISATALFL